MTLATLIEISLFCSYNLFWSYSAWPWPNFEFIANLCANA